MNEYSITFDIDWAPDFMIKKIADKLIEKNIKSTWFVTHQSPFLKELFVKNDLFEFGIHPNFLENSTHGATENEVLDYICEIVPNSTSVRSHTLFQASRVLLNMVEKYNIEVDCNILLYKTRNIQPHKISFSDSQKELIRIPFFWEDDICMYDKEKSWDISDPIYHVPGLKVFNFHPVFIYLNCDTMTNYEELKKVKHLQELNENESNQYVNTIQNGTKTFFNNLIEYISFNKIETKTMREIAENYKNSETK